MPLTKKINEIIFRFNNQFFYGEGVNTYLISFKKTIILFDLPKYSKELENYLTTFNKPITALLSHGPCGIADGKIWQQKLGIIIYLHEKDKNNEWLKVSPNILFKSPPQFSKQIQIIHTPGHTPGSICLYEKTTKTLFTGDTFGGDENGDVWDFNKKDGYGNLNQRLNSCRKLLSYDFDFALPFHYEMILGNAKEKLKNFINSSPI